MPEAGLARLPRRYQELLADAQGAAKQPGVALNSQWVSDPPQPGEATLRPYEPTWLDRLGMLIAGGNGDPIRRRLARELVGTSGTGRGAGTGIGGSGVSALDVGMLYGPQAPAALALNASDAIERGDYGAAALMAAPVVGRAAAPAISGAVSAAPRAATAGLAALGATATGASAGDPGDQYGVLRPQLPSEPQPRAELMPDESAMPEAYRTNPRLRQKWYASELEKLKPVNERRAVEDAQRRQEWMASVQAAQEKYAADLGAAEKAERERRAGMTFLEKYPDYRYVPLGASMLAGGVGSMIARRAQNTQRAWDTGLSNLTGELRTAIKGGEAARVGPLRANVAEYAATGRPAGDMSKAGYITSAMVGPEFAAAPTVIDLGTPGRPREEAYKEMQDPLYWVKTYGVPLAAGASAAKTGVMLTKKSPDAVPGARGAIAEATAAESNAIAQMEAERRRLQGVLDAQEAKRAAAREKSAATREARRQAEAMQMQKVRRVK